MIKQSISLRQNHVFSVFVILALFLIILSLFSQQAIAQNKLEQNAKKLSFQAEVFTNYQATKSANLSTKSFEIDRAEVGFQNEINQKWMSELRLESIRSAGENSLYGIDEDSLLIRLKQAWIQRQLKWQSLKSFCRVGLIPSWWQSQILYDYDLRAQGATLFEREKWTEVSDLGASIAVSIKSITFAWQILNGESLRLREQNLAKDNLLLLHWQFLRLDDLKSFAHLAFAYQDGSQGIAMTRNHRQYGQIYFQHPSFRIGLSVGLAQGLQKRPELEANAFQSWTEIKIWQNLSIFGRYEYMSIQSSDQKPKSNWFAIGSIWKFEHDQGISSQISLQFFKQSSNDMLTIISGIPKLAEEWKIVLNFAFRLGEISYSTLSAREVFNTF